jgi:hypothetical protein
MLRSWISKFTLLGWAGLVWTPAAEPAIRKTVPPKLNGKVVQFARASLGKKVGNGECWTLADQALRHASARRPGRDGLAVYAFGRQLGGREKLLPGDILQFEKAEFYHKDQKGWSSHSMPHHTAVIYKVAGSKVTLLHQNVGGKKTVQTATIDLAERTKGTVTMFRPQVRRN